MNKNIAVTEKVFTSLSFVMLIVGIGQIQSISGPDRWKFLLLLFVSLEVFDAAVQKLILKRSTRDTATSLAIGAAIYAAVIVWYFYLFQ